MRFNYGIHTDLNKNAGNSPPLPRTFKLNCVGREYPFLRLRLADNPDRYFGGNRNVFRRLVGQDFRSPDFRADLDNQFLLASFNYCVSRRVVTIAACQSLCAELVWTTSSCSASEPSSASATPQGSRRVCACTRACMLVCVYACMRVCVYVCMCVLMCLCDCVCACK